MLTPRELLIVVSLVIIAGCTGGGGGAAGGDGSADWCTSASTTQFSNPQTGEQVSMEIEGIVELDGHTVCKGVWETNQGDVRRMELYWTEDESYRKMITYNGSGATLNEIVMSNG